MPILVSIETAQRSCGIFWAEATYVPSSWCDSRACCRRTSREDTCSTLVHHLPLQGIFNFTEVKGTLDANVLLIMCVIKFLAYTWSRIIAGNFCLFAPCSHGQNFYPVNFLACVNDCIEPMVIFTAWAKNYYTKYFCSTCTRVGKIFGHRNFFGCKA